MGQKRTNKDWSTVFTQPRMITHDEHPRIGQTRLQPTEHQVGLPENCIPPNCMVENTHIYIYIPYIYIYSTVYISLIVKTATYCITVSPILRIVQTSPSGNISCKLLPVLRPAEIHAFDAECWVMALQFCSFTSDTLVIFTDSWNA